MRPLIILGMHRSGTSVAAALLADAGVDIGDRLLEANWSNPRGHFEDKDFVEFQQEALARLGLDDSGWLTADPPELPVDLVERARALVDQKRRLGRVWGWKDPRTVLFLPLWSRLLPDAAFAIVYRAPWEVVESLFRRGDEAFAIDPELAVKVWLYYNRALLNLSIVAADRSVLVNIETIGEDPAAWTAALSRATGIPLRTPSTAIYEPKLLHGDAAHERASLLCRYFPDVAELYSSLERQAFRPTGASQRVTSPGQVTADVERRRVLSDWRAASAVPRKPTASASTQNPGWCPCCRSETRFVETGAWLRDQYLCERCQSIPRFRVVNLTLDTYFGGWERSRIHEFSPTNDFIGRFCEGYSSSSDDIDRLPLADSELDLLVTQDVLNHVLHPDKALQEISRVLKAGGAHVFTVPKHKGLEYSRERVRVRDETVEHLLPPQYHGDPQHNTRALVTWDFGDDFETIVWTWCGYPTTAYVTRDRRFGLDGEFLDVFVTRKIAR